MQRARIEPSFKVFLQIINCLPAGFVQGSDRGNTAGVLSGQGKWRPCVCSVMGNAAEQQLSKSAEFQPCSHPCDPAEPPEQLQSLTPGSSRGSPPSQPLANRTWGSAGCFGRRKSPRGLIYSARLPLNCTQRQSRAALPCLSPCLSCLSCSRWDGSRAGRERSPARLGRVGKRASNIPKAALL